MVSIDQKEVYRCRIKWQDVGKSWVPYPVTLRTSTFVEHSFSDEQAVQRQKPGKLMEEDL